MNRNVIFDEYFDAIYNASNKFSEKEYEEHCDYYELLYSTFLPQDKNSRILDVGCGGGHFIKFIEQKGYKNFLGIDISPQQVEFCKTHITGEVQQADAFEFLKDAHNAYDLIVAHDVLEHIPKYKVIPFLKLIHSALKVGGQFFMKTPNLGNLFALRLRYADFSHQIGFTEKSLYQVFWIAGFRTIQILPSPELGLLNKLVARMIRFCIMKLMWYQGFVAPKILSPVLIGIVKK